MRISDWSSDVCSSDLEPDLAQHDRRYRRNVVGIERDERRETAVARDRARAVAAHRLGDPWPQYGKRVQAAANIVIAQLIATLSQNIGELSPRGDARTAVRGRLAQDGSNHRVRRSDEHTSELQALT